MSIFVLNNAQDLIPEYACVDFPVELYLTLQVCSTFFPYFYPDAAVTKASLEPSDDLSDDSDRVLLTELQLVIEFILLF